MFDLLITEDTPDRALLEHILKEMKLMALDLTKLTAAVAASAAATDKLILAHTDPAAQTAVDALQVSLDTKTAEAVAAITPAPVA